MKNMSTSENLKNDLNIQMKNNTNTNSSSIKIIVHTAMFAAIIVVLSQIAIPMPTGVPITLQTFAIALCGYVLGWKYGIMSTGIYIMLGAVGLPVFANLKGGFQILLGMTGGFIWGFLILAGLCGLHTILKNKYISIAFGILGLILCHILGILQFSVVAGSTFVESALLVSLPYLAKDIASVVAAYLIATTIRKRLNIAGLINL